MRPFTASFACRSGAHCGTCRDRDGGRTWRTAIAKAFDVGPTVDFDCPHDRPWGFDPPPRPIRSPLPVVPLTDEQVEEERRRLAAGGCCGAPTNA